MERSKAPAPIAMMLLFTIALAGCGSNERSQSSGDSVTSTTVDDAQQCASGPRELMTPVDLGKVTGILYPGQERGNEYWPCPVLADT